MIKFIGIFFLLVASDTIHLSLKWRKILTWFCKEGQRRVNAKEGRKVSLVNSFQQVVFWYYILDIQTVMCRVRCTDSLLWQCWILGCLLLEFWITAWCSTFMLSEHLLLGHFNGRDGAKLCCIPPFPLFSSFLSFPHFEFTWQTESAEEGTSQFNVSDECRQLGSNTRASLHSAIMKYQDLDQKNAFSWLARMFSFKVWHVKLQLLFLKFSKARENM